MADSIFTQIINRELPATIRYEDDHFIAFDDLHPSAPIDILIVSKKPYPYLQEIPSSDVETLAGLLQTIQKVAAKMDIAENYRVVINVGEQMQQVKHVHLHLMGGWSPSRLEIIKQKNI